MKHIKKIDFAELLENNDFSPFFSYILNSETKAIVSESETNNFLNNKGYLIDEVPSYFKTKLNTVSKSIKQKSINLYEGSLINITQYNSINDYLEKEISTQRRSNINRCQKRFDLCFNVDYKMYYGDITKETYDQIFSDYKLMLKRRLQQKNRYWEEIEYWEKRYAKTFDLILEKKASIFVIYISNVPVSIYINSNFNDIMCIEVIAYDIDYAKFKLGFLALVKVIDWAIQNNYKLIDMSKGDFEYKERFRNGTYKFQKHLIYDSRNFLTRLEALLIYLKIKFIYTLLPILKKFKINKLYRFALNKKYKSRLITGVQNDINLHTEKINSIDLNSVTKIDLENNDYAFLKEAFNNYLFLNFEKSLDSEVFKTNSEKEEYFFKGKKTIQKILVKY